MNSVKYHLSLSVVRRRVFLLLICTPVLLLLPLHLHFKLPFPHPISQPHDLCHLININPSVTDLWQFSARSLCLSHDLCFNLSDLSSPALLHSADLSLTRCQLRNPDYTLRADSFPPVALLNTTRRTCRQLQRHAVHCAHGTGLKDADPVCPDIQQVSPLVLRTATWFEALSIVIPDYEIPRNIYHFLSPVADLARTVEHLPKLLHDWDMYNTYTAGNQTYFTDGDMPRLKALNLVFHMSKEVPLGHLWKKELLELMIRQRMQNKGIRIKVYLIQERSPEQRYICLRNAVLLGRRGHVNVWPFPNATDVPLDGLSVPIDAIAFKKAVYDEFGMQARLPEMVQTRLDSALSELPPFVVGYSKREGESGGDGYYRAGAMRNFFDDDEEWFMSMLRNETRAAGAKLLVISANSSQTLREQVERVVQVGMLVGIHGANLVNAVFMHPFGALLEIMPKFVKERCYVAGANSGLKYMRVEASEEVSVVESGCHPQDFMCKIDPRQRALRLRDMKDRELVREKVQEGLEHLRWIRERFPDGVPVSYNSESVYYEVVNV